MTKHKSVKTSRSRRVRKKTLIEDTPTFLETLPKTHPQYSNWLEYCSKLREGSGRSRSQYIASVLGGLPDPHAIIDAAVLGFEEALAALLQNGLVKDYETAAANERDLVVHRKKIMEAVRAWLRDYTKSTKTKRRSVSQTLSVDSVGLLSELELRLLEAFEKWKAEAWKAARPTATPLLKARSAWLYDRLKERAWEKHDIKRHDGPEHKTVQKILDGRSVRADALQRLADSLSKKHSKVNPADIPED